MPKSAEVAETLYRQQVDGEALVALTAENMQTVGILMGPAVVLAKRIAAVSAPPTAASGFQAGASADWKGAWVSLWKFVRTT